MATELLPCPFCGGDGVVEWEEIRTAYGSTGIERTRVVCENEDCLASNDFRPNREEAIAAWNRRADYDGDYTAVDLDETQGFTLQEKPEDNHP